MEQLVPAFSLGVLSSLSPCALPLYPGFLAYLAAHEGGAGRARAAGVAVLAGLLAASLAAGAAVTLLSIALGSVLAILTPLADLAVLALGIALLAGASPFARLRTPAPRAAGAPALRQAFLYGALYGPLTLPCTGALAVSVFALALGAETGTRILFFVAFGVGMGLPLLLLAFAADRVRVPLARALARRGAPALRVAGALLVAVGAFDLAQNLPSALHYLGA